MTTNGPTPEDIRDAVDCIESELPWSVIDWHHESGRYDEPMLRLELTWDPVSSEDMADVSSAVLGAVEHQEGDDGALVADVIKDVLNASDQDLSERVVREAIDQLKSTGEIYEPRTDHLKAT